MVQLQLFQLQISVRVFFAWHLKWCFLNLQSKFVKEIIWHGRSSSGLDSSYPRSPFSSHVCRSRGKTQPSTAAEGKMPMKVSDCCFSRTRNEGIGYMLCMRWLENSGDLVKAISILIGLQTECNWTYTPGGRNWSHLLWCTFRASLLISVKW